MRLVSGRLSIKSFWHLGRKASRSAESATESDDAKGARICAFAPFASAGNYDNFLDAAKAKARVMLTNAEPIPMPVPAPEELMNIPVKLSNKNNPQIIAMPTIATAARTGILAFFTAMLKTLTRIAMIGGIERIIARGIPLTDISCAPL